MPYEFKSEQSKMSSVLRTPTGSSVQPCLDSMRRCLCVQTFASIRTIWWLAAWTSSLWSLSTRGHETPCRRASSWPSRSPPTLRRQLQGLQHRDTHTQSEAFIQLHIIFSVCRHEAERLEQEARGKLERQKITDQAEAERARKELLELEALRWLC